MGNEYTEDNREPKAEKAQSRAGLNNRVCSSFCWD